MAKSRPVLLTAALSAAAVLGYLTYRGLAPDAEGGANTWASRRGTERGASSRRNAARFFARQPEGEPQSILSWPGKPLLINFWATWCAPCLREIPMLKALQEARPDLQVVGIAIDKRDPVVEFAGNMQFNYPILVGQNEAWAAAGALGVNIYALPFTIFTAADGAVLGVHTGELHAEHLDAFRTTVDDLAAGRIDVAAARERLAAPL